MEGAEGEYSLTATEGQYGISLHAVDTKAPVLHGDGGIIDMGPAGKSYYYSRTNLEVRGTITVEGIEREVTGNAWMDHQWGDFGRERVRWNWFSLQLEDHTELMAVLFWDIDTGELVQRYGTYVLLGGSPRYLTREDIEVTALSSWTSPNTGITYPMKWVLGVEPLKLTLDVEPVHLDAEFHVSRFAPLVYWEGAATFSGLREGIPVSGRGFVEMGGYGTGDLLSDTFGASGS